MKILMLAPEVAPFVKVGGLADVLGALPKALRSLGHDVRLVCPLHGTIKRDPSWIPYEHSLTATLGHEVIKCRVWEGTLPGSDVVIYFLEHNDFYGRKEVYAGPWGDHGDNPQRFTYLTRAGLNLCYYLGWMPDVIHCHDWTVGLAPLYLNTTDLNGPLGRAATVMTVHNLQHQGVFPEGAKLAAMARLPASVMRPDCLDHFGSANLMKAGLYNSSKITTVSPTYAAEIQTAEHGWGLEGLLKFRSADLVGIINGIDEEEWNPATDTRIPARFSVKDLSGKAACKAALQKTLGLEVDPNVPIFGVVSRLFDQKGLDLLAEIVPGLMDTMKIQIALLGAGEPSLENAFRVHSAKYPGRVGAHLGYQAALSNLIYAGSDFFVMPSRFEPCGLSQIYSMRYGTLPIVRSTGGLKDTVDNFDGKTGGTGFVFQDATPSALFNTMGWACATYYDNPSAIQALRLNAMRKDFGWKKSAEAYSDVYQWAVEARRRAF